MAQALDTDFLPYLFSVILVVALLFVKVVFLDRSGGFFLNTIIAGWQNMFITISNNAFVFYSPFGKKKLSQQHRELLFKKNHYYRYLSPEQRKAFDNRLVHFKASRSFIARNNVVLTEEMKLLISATAVQMTFGLRWYMMREFSRIAVFPEAYYNKVHDRFHKGEVNPNGLVILNWKDFYSGNEIPNDSINLGIHEFAHTLALQQLNNNAFKDRFFEDNFNKLMNTISNPVFRKIIQQRAGLRNYALTNPMEFFAVVSEAFFENPFQLYRNHKSIYVLLTKMYNQDLIRFYKKGVQPLTNLSLNSQ